MAVDITPNKDGGVLKEILADGEGTAKPPSGSSVEAHYHGTLTDGTVFDSSVDRGVPFSFTLGKGSVIKAWDLGVATMLKGEKARFTCKSEYAYGERGSPPKIPGGATLIFDIELLSWKEEDLSKANDGGILRTILEEGKGSASPVEFRLCKVHLKGQYENKEFDNRELSFTLGEGIDNGVPKGIERALEKMKEGEKSRITLKPLYGWPKGNDQFKIPADATLVYEVTLISFEKDKEVWSLDAAQQITEAELFKAKATEYFKAEKYKLAIKLYNKAQEYVSSDTGFSETEEVDRKKILLAVRLNLALAHLKLKEPYDAKNACDQALELDPNNVKGLFRRGQAYLAVNEPEIAKADFQKVVEIEPNNNAAHSQINACIQKIKEIRAKEKQIYSNMFEKLAKKDKEHQTVFGWWDEDNRKPIISEIIPEDKEDVEERKREKKKQLEYLKKVAEEKRKAREEAAKLALEKGENVEQASENENLKATQEEVVSNGAEIVPESEKQTKEVAEEKSANASN